MALMMEKLYDALLAGNVPEDKARAAAVEAASYENRLARIESDLLLLKWMIGGVGGGVLTLIIKAFM
jgi:hypothetical protein